jgi:hypothetical protein
MACLCRLDANRSVEYLDMMFKVDRIDSTQMEWCHH